MYISKEDFMTADLTGICRINAMITQVTLRRKVMMRALRILYDFCQRRI